jgi:cell division protease FtsH
MGEKIKYLKEEIKYKQWLLENARQVLKDEFVGIDNVIDKVVDSLNTWFLFPELQERPVVINLWGMTGVGKTALIIRLSNLLEYDNK